MSEKLEHQKKVVYFGIDALIGCLELIAARGYDVVHIFTMPDDSYDKTIRIQEYASLHNISYTCERVSKNDIDVCEKNGVELIIVAGYQWKIPVSQSIKQVNIHPAYLPYGRGSWPMPVAILKGFDSGVTLHKLSDRIDEGDLILQERIQIRKQDNLVTLMDKIKKVSEKLLDTFLDNVDALWENACPQGKGEYWQEPGDTERTICLEDGRDKISDTLRAFYGYGCLCNLGGVPVEIIRGSVVSDKKEVGDTELCLSLPDGYLHCEEWRLAFREIKLEDKDRVETIRKKYHPLLSDYTFALLYCWQGEMQLSIHIEDDFYVVKSRDYFFFPIGSPDRIRKFIDGIIALGIKPEFRFCDENMLELIQNNYQGKYDFFLSRDDSDYMVSNEIINKLQGSCFAKRRNAYAHYSKLQPAPQTEIITKDNMDCLNIISELFCGKDVDAEKIAIEHFSELDMIGIVVKKGSKYVGFSLCSQKDEKTMQGHFMKCISSERGSKFYLMKSCIDTFSDKYEYTNMEDDMGNEGLREFKSSFNAELVSSYTITF